MNTRFIDLRSDTVTLPSEEMYDAIRNAPIGDDVFGDDPTVAALENLAAETLGKEAAMYVPTGTMGNQSAIMTATHAGDEIIAGAKSHIINYEGGAAARLSGVGYALVDNPDGTIHADDVIRLCRPLNDNRYPETKMVCLENALYDGRVVPLEIMNETCNAAHSLGLHVHLDGARVFNAALSLGVEVKKLVENCDSIMFCISKGLSSPVGSLLCGKADFIEKAKVMRKLMGGGMREAGILAACGIVSITKMVDRLQEDHDNARLLASMLQEIPGIDVIDNRLDINMVFWRTSIENFDQSEFVRHMYKNGIKTLPEDEGAYRFCTHYGITREDVIKVVEATSQYCKSLI